jgi:flagellar hook-basal body complex protein FliE
MSDPVGLISGSGGAGNLQPKPGAPSQGGGPSFRDVLMENLNHVNELQNDAREAVEDLATGRRADVEGVILATEKADNAFRALQAVRNKVVEAYQEFQQMRV